MNSTLIIPPNSTPQLLTASRTPKHTPKSGLNPVADAAAPLFSLIGQLKGMTSLADPCKLQCELISEIDIFHETVKNHGYSAEYAIVSRYIVCAMLDDLMANSPACKELAAAFSLLAHFNQDKQHEEKFFTIMDRTIKEPALYIDLMELLYLCLSMEYKGRYRHEENGQYQLEQITNSLYRHIRLYRGSFSKILSPNPPRGARPGSSLLSRRKTSLRSIFIVTACIILTILISLGYLMDVIANEPYKNTANTGIQV